MRIEGPRARNGSGLPSGDRPQRWGALLTGVCTQRFARMWYMVPGFVPARIEVSPSNGLGAQYTPTLNSEMHELGSAKSKHPQLIMYNNIMTNAQGRQNPKPLNIRT